MNFIEKAEKSIEAYTQSGKNACCKRTIEQGEGIEKADKIKGEEGTDKNEYEDIIFPGSRACRFFLRLQEFRLLENEGEKLMDGP